MQVELLKFKNKLLEKYRLIRNIFTVLIILTALWSIYTFETPVVYKEDYLASSYTHEGKYTYTAPVTNSNPLYAVGDELEMGMPAYFFSISPSMDMLFTYYLVATDSSVIDIKIESNIVVTSRNSGGDVFWQKSLPLESSSSVSTEGNEALHSFVVNVPDVQAQVKSLQEQIGYSPGTEIEVVTIVSYKGTINGKHVDDAQRFGFPLTISDSYYQIPEKLEFSDTNDLYITRSVKRDAGVDELKTPLFFVLFFILLMILIALLKNTEMTDSLHIEKLERERENSKFDDWISMGKFPSNLSFPEVTVNSLQDLVDIAADMGARVLRDSEKEIYFVIKDATLYVYSK